MGDWGRGSCRAARMRYPSLFTLHPSLERRPDVQLAIQDRLGHRGGKRYRARGRSGAGGGRCYGGDVGRRAEVLEREADAIKRSGGKAEVEALDVSNTASVKRATEAILSRHSRIDVLVDSAGLNNRERYWRDQTVESWDQVIRINLDGTFYCTHAVIPSIRRHKAGVVINISSWAGVYASALVGAAYNGSKAAVISLT